MRFANANVGAVMGAFLLFSPIDTSLAKERTPPLIWNVPYSLSVFVGRQDVLGEVSDRLRKDNVLAIVGTPGVGKTHLALRYAREHAGDYQIIWFFDCARDINEQFLEFASRINELQGTPKKLPRNSVQVIVYVNDFLRRTDKKWLIIFDGFNEYQVEHFMPEHHGVSGKHTIITSNLQNWRVNMPLKKLSREESIELLKKKIKQPLDRRELDRLAESQSDYPLSLVLAAANLNNAEGLAVDQLIAKTGRFHIDALPASILMLTERLRKHNPAYYDLLSFLSLIGHSKIDRELINLVEVAGLKDDEFGKALGTLVDFSLIEKIEDGSQVFYGLHQTVQDLIRQEMTKEQKAKAVQIGLRASSKLLNREIKDVANLFEKQPTYVDHLLTLFTRMEEDGNVAETLSGKIKILYYLYYYKRDYEQAAKLTDEISLHTSTLGDQSMELARFYNILGAMRFMKSTLADAVAETQKARKILANIDGEEARRELVLLLTNNLGYYYLFQGDLASAVGCLNEAEKWLPDMNDAEYQGSFYFLKTQLMIDEGQFDDAMKNLEKIFALTKDNTPLADIFVFADILKAEILIKSQAEQGRVYQAAREAYEKAKRVFGTEDHEMVARSRIILESANAYAGKSCSVEALKKSILILDDFFGGEGKNRRQAFAYKVVGDILTQQQAYPQALEAYEKAEAIYNKLLANKAVDDVSALCASLVLLGAKMDRNGIISQYFNLQIEHFGFKHPRTHELVSYLDANNIKIPG